MRRGMRSVGRRSLSRPRRCSARMVAFSMLLVGAVLASSIATGPHASAAAASTTPIVWAPCPQASGYLCGKLRVPLDYQHPTQGSLRLAVIEHRVAHSRGVVIFNPGGPGESGVLILPILASLVPAVVRDDFTLVSFDERGTGSSDPLLCGPSVAAAGSAIAGTAAATRVFAPRTPPVGPPTRRSSRPWTQPRQPGTWIG